MQPFDNTLQQLFRPDNGFDIVTGRIETDYDVTATVGQTFKD